MHHLRQSGWGSPVVVFENGLGDRLETWQTVQDYVSQFAQTFSYNRAGYAGSAPAAGIRDAATIVAELRRLLAARGLQPPYLLVGHSIGGLYMQFYARNFPGEVAGLVLVDSSHWAQSERMRQVSPALAGNVQAERLRMTGVNRLESDSFDASGKQVRNSPPLRDLPMVVLSAGRYASGTARAAGSNVRARRGFEPAFWFGLQRDLAAQLPGARHIVARQSGHFIQQQEPQVVAIAVRDMILENVGRDTRK